MSGLDLTGRVTTKEPYEWRDGSGAWRVDTDDADLHVVVVDYGIKRNILRCFADLGCRLTVLPADASADDVLAREPDGVFLSNGPGDPSAVAKGIETAGELTKQEARLRHLPRPPAPLARARREDLQAQVRPPRAEPPGQGPHHRQDRDHDPEPRLRGRSRGPPHVARVHPPAPQRRHLPGRRARRQRRLRRAVPPRGERRPARLALPLPALRRSHARLTLRPAHPWFNRRSTEGETMPELHRRAIAEAVGDRASPETAEPHARGRPRAERRSATRRAPRPPPESGAAEMARLAPALRSP